MAEPHFATGHDDDDDLPRTFRRAKQERAREGLGPTAQNVDPRAEPASPLPPYDAGRYESAPDPAMPYGEDPFDYGDERVTVERFDVPFFRLTLFFIKCVFAAIPALMVLGVMLYGVGQLLKLYLPWLLQAEIIIRLPN